MIKKHLKKTKIKKIIQKKLQMLMIKKYLKKNIYLQMKNKSEMNYNSIVMEYQKIIKLVRKYTQ